jgi:hypothetical protein
MHPSSDGPEAELIRFMQALMMLATELCEVLLQILGTVPGFEALRVDLLILEHLNSLISIRLADWKCMPARRG